MNRLARLTLDAARREVARRAAAGGPGDALDADRLAAVVEADPAAGDALDAAVREAHREAEDDLATVAGARARRRARTDRALAAIDDLLLAGELAPDGPGRVVLPGFSGSTWRAIAILRRAAPGPQSAWAAALVAEPYSDLGDAAPAAPPADARLAAPARRVLALEAERQDVRDALIRAEAAGRHANARGFADSARTVEGDIRALERALAGIDATIEDVWDAGLRRAAALRATP